MSTPPLLPSTSKLSNAMTEDVSPTRSIAAHLRAYGTVALVLQGGGALGAYQAGVYEGLAEAGVLPDRLAGISIGALNAAIIAGNAPARRVEALRGFWETVSAPPLLPRLPFDEVGAHHAGLPEPVARAAGALNAWRALVEGQRGFFVPRPWPPLLSSASVPPEAASWYDTTPLRATLERFADIDRVNDGGVAVSVAAVNVRTGNFRYFDNQAGRRLRLEHFLASGALPPGFPAVEVDGEYWWDGGLVSNTPLQQVIEEAPRQDALVFQVDLWSANGRLPDDIGEAMTRQKEIQFSSRTRAITDLMRQEQELRTLLRELMALVPQERRDGQAWQRACERAVDRRINVLHLIYRARPDESHYKDYQFGSASMQEHWASGLADIRRTLARPEWLARPEADRPFVTHDVHRGGEEGASPAGGALPG